MTRDIRAFVSRDWHEARRAKDEYWGARIARLGAAEGFRVAEELRRQALRLNPDWPGDVERRQDLLDHVCFAERLRRASPARGR